MSEEVMNTPTAAENPAEHGQNKAPDTAGTLAANEPPQTEADGDLKNTGKHGDTPGPTPEPRATAEVFGLNLEELLADPQLSPGLRADPELEKEFKELALELALGQEQAQKLAGLYVRSLNRHIDKFSSEHAELMRQTEAQWINELKTDQDFSAQVGKARAAIKAYGGPELINVLEETRLGSHPAFVRFMAKVGADLAEPSFTRTQAAAQQRSPAEVLYPNQGR